MFSVKERYYFENWNRKEFDNDGFALAGDTGPYGAGKQDFWLVKTDSSGKVQWDKTYGGEDYDFAHSVVQTSDGGFAIAGGTDSYGAGDWDFWLVKVTTGQP